MTRNPRHYEDNVLKHVGPGINDGESRLYKGYDSRGRVDQSFQQKAALHGVRNLETKAFRKDSPVRQTQGRFPEKYVDTRPTALRSKPVQPYSYRQPSGLAEQVLSQFDTYDREQASFPPYQKMSQTEQQLVLEGAFSQVCDNIMANQMNNNTDMWLQLSVDDKLLQFASFLSHLRKDFRLGAIVGVYLLLKNNRLEDLSVDHKAGGTIIGKEITKVIMEEIFSSLTEFKL